MPLYGHELSLDIVPAQAGLGRVVAADKEDFVGRAGLSRRRRVRRPRARRTRLGGQARRPRRLRRLDPSTADGRPVGEITSGALSPTLGHPIAMAFVSPRVSEPGTELTIDVRGTRIPATVTALPFYRRAQ